MPSWNGNASWNSSAQPYNASWRWRYRQDWSSDAHTVHSLDRTGCDAAQLVRVLGRIGSRVHLRVNLYSMITFQRMLRNLVRIFGKIGSRVHLRVIDWQLLSTTGQVGLCGLNRALMQIIAHNPATPLHHNCPAAPLHTAKQLRCTTR